MNKNVLGAAVAASLCAASSGAFAGGGQPINLAGPTMQSQWTLEHYITVCSNNGNGNFLETVTTGVTGCLKFVPGDTTLEAATVVNGQIGLSCVNGPDCDPKPDGED